MKRIFKKIVKELSTLKDIKAIILYGSFARGEYSSRSDIDLFILTTKKQTQKEVEEKIIKLESDVGRNIQPTVRTITELQKTDTGLLQNIFQEGKIIYLKETTEIPVAILLQQKPYLIYLFHINSLSQKDKVKFNRHLYTQTRKGYEYKGLLQKIAGQKLSAGCVMIPYNKKRIIENFLKRFKVKYSPLKIWK